MRRGPTSIIDRSLRQPQAEPQRASWYTPGMSDGLGDRLLMFDNTTASSLELLRFRQEFSDQPAFEAGLRRRLEELDGFRDASIAHVRAVKWLGDGEGLALVSDRVEGRRLSELLHEARGPILAMELIRQLTPVLAALQAHGAGISHGALTADRIVIGPEGRLILVEHVLGPALEALQLPADRMRAELGLAVPSDDGPVVLDRRADVVQLALVALALVRGRAVDPADYPENIGTLLDEVPLTGSAMPPALRVWLERALQPGRPGFQSADEAHHALTELLETPEPRPGRRGRALEFPKPADALVAPPFEWPEPRALSAAPTSEIVTETVAAAVVAEPDVAMEAPTAPSVDKARLSPGVRRVIRWAGAAVAILAIAEAVVIARLIYSRRASTPPASTAAVKPPSPAPTTTTTNDPSSTTLPPSPGATPRPDGAAESPTTGAPVTDTAHVATKPAPPVAPPVTPPTTAARTRSEASPADASGTATAAVGGIKLISPIDLQAFEDGKLVGSTAGAMAVGAGTHALELVNETLGYRTRQTVDVRAGRTTSLTITPPRGRISINATPWAEVWIDGAPMGETPLANLSVPIGEHQIVFRHPQLGEQHQTAIVKVDVLTRISAKLER